MSRSISIGYRYEADGPATPIDVRPPYFLLGTQDISKRFWSIPLLKEIGVSQLSELGVLDPVYFIGWDMMDDLAFGRKHDAQRVIHRFSRLTQILRSPGGKKSMAISVNLRKSL
jgi:hypothetical protein